MNGQSTSTISSAIGDDTIELQLTPEQLLELSQPAELDEPFASGQASAFAPPERIFPEFSSAPPLFSPPPSSPARRWHQTPIAKMGGAIIAYTALAWWSASQLAGQPKPPATAATRPPAAIARPALSASPAKPEVRVVNPFDKTEVFEFPAGTSGAEGREKVAQILLQRARDRQSQWERIKPAPNMRTASLYRPR